MSTEVHGGGREHAVAGSEASARLVLLDGFALRAARDLVDLAPSAQRLLAFLALSAGPRPRSQVAGTLWPDMVDEQASAALRSAVWRVRRARPDLLRVTPTQLTLAGHVEVDVGEVTDLARRLVRRDAVVTRHELEEASIGGSLLPGWHDDWLMIERERLHQLQVHGLEALAERLLLCGSHGAAVEAVLTAVRLDPLRESPHRILIQIHLREGNLAEAVRAYRRFRQLLRDELGVEPSRRCAELVGRFLQGDARPGDARPGDARPGDVRPGDAAPTPP